MPRKYVLTVDWMNRARANGWAINYERRQNAVAFGEDMSLRVLRTLDWLRFPDPQIDLSGWLDKEASGLMMGEKVREACRAAGLPLADYEMLARWYWSAEDWQVYVHAFNQLPDAVGYQWSWAGREWTTKIVPIVPVDNLGTSGYKSALVPVPRDMLARGKR